MWSPPPPVWGWLSVAGGARGLQQAILGTEKIRDCGAGRKATRPDRAAIPQASRACSRCGGRRAGTADGWVDPARAHREELGGLLGLEQGPVDPRRPRLDGLVFGGGHRAFSGCSMRVILGWDVPCPTAVRLASWPSARRLGDAARSAVRGGDDNETRVIAGPGTWRSVTPASTCAPRSSKTTRRRRVCRDAHLWNHLV
jgi:hypothetical protein